VILTGRDPATGRALALRIADGRIAAVQPGPEDDPHWLAPGLVDLQVNGWRGNDLNAAEPPTPHTVMALTDALAAEGVTTFLPTLITAAEDRIVAALRAIVAARAADARVARAIPGVHVEGPSVSAEDGPRGAHPLPHVRPPDLGEFDRWQDACGGLVRMVTLAPEQSGAVPYIAALARRGVLVALGHSAADERTVTAAAAAGARISTHLGNGVAAMLPRHPNLIWAQLAEDALSASFIADGHHLPDAALKSMLRAKGLARSMLVSDATALGGMPPGRYSRPIGGEVELSADGRLSMAGTPYLAGAARPLRDGVVVAMRAAGLTLDEALRLASANPARLLGQAPCLAAGAPADLIRFRFVPGDATLALETVMQGGVRVT
jgi:N-acetylglucosamine-6-phosphate deacetylase